MHSSPKLKCDAPSELIEQVQAIEDQSDRWADNLALFGFSHDASVWGVLTQIIHLIEQHIELYGHGSQEQREAMINLGKAGARLIVELRRAKWHSKPVWLRWTGDLEEASRQGVFAAHNYEAFVSCFTMWHKNRMAVEIQSPTRVRFRYLEGSSA